MKWNADNLKGAVALLVVLASFTYFFVVHFSGHQADPQIIIAIVAANSTVLQYYFGSSQGANKKDDIIAANIAANETK